MKKIGLLEGIFTYPVKSCKWLTHSEVEVNALGLSGDRQFMLVDAKGQFITQRQLPLLSKLQFQPSQNSLLIALDQNKIDLELDGGRILQNDVKIWKDAISNTIEFPEVSTWLSDVLQRKVHFIKKPVEMDSRSKFIPKTGETIGLSLVDGYPIHVVNLASLKDIEERTKQDLSPMRFRPNFLISGLDAYEEEAIDVIEGQGFALKVIKPAGRCSVPNIDPEDQSKGKEPMRTLATYKTAENSVTFGVYATIIKTGKALLGEDLSLYFS